MRLKKQYGHFDQQAASRLARTLKATLLPRRKSGRKPDESPLRAAELGTAAWEAYRHEPAPPSRRRFQEDLWQRIYAAVIPAALTMHPAERMHLTELLRRRVHVLLGRQQPHTKSVNGSPQSLLLLACSLV